MLEQILRYINNWFVVDAHSGEFSVENGGITLPFLANGQYFRVIGSVFNDGLHQYPAENMTAEMFCGTVQSLAIPADVVLLADDIAEWLKNNRSVAESPFQSESFGNYSYTKSSDSAGWQGTFKTRLNVWRKL